jgi:tetratricopeptide (TPR) repeat protein
MSDFLAKGGSEVSSSAEIEEISSPSVQRSEGGQDSKKATDVDDADVLSTETTALKINEGEEEVETELVLEKNIGAANEAKEEGNKYFRVKDYDNAITMYSRAIALCPTDEDDKETLAVFLGNRAAAYYAVDEYDCTIDDCTKSLELNPDYVKVLMRRSQAYEKVSKPEEALAGKSQSI